MSLVQEILDNFDEQISMLDQRPDWIRSLKLGIFSHFRKQARIEVLVENMANFCLLYLISWILYIRGS